MKIFGDKKNPEGMPWLANVVVLDYAKNNPSIMDPKTAGGAHSRRKRCAVVLGEYIHTQGKRHARRDVRKRLKLDCEAFCSEMERVRKWKADVSLGWWEKMKMDPACKGDQNGPPGLEQRLKPYRWMIPADFSESEDESFETKQFSKSTGAMKNVKETEEARLLQEVRQGFRTAAAGSSLAAPLPPSAMTYTGEASVETVGEMMSRHLNPASASAATPTKAPSGSACLAGATENLAGSPLAGGASSLDSGPVVDIRSMCSSVYRNAMQEMKVQERRIHASLTLLAGALKDHRYTCLQDEDEYHCAYERYQSGLLWLGAAPNYVAPSSGSGSPVLEFTPLDIEAVKNMARRGSRLRGAAAPRARPPAASPGHAFRHSGHIGPTLHPQPHCDRLPVMRLPLLLLALRRMFDFAPVGILRRLGRADLSACLA